MADSPISSLSDVDTMGGMTGNELLVFARGGLNGRFTPLQLWAWIESTYGPFASTVNLNNKTPETHPVTAAAADDEFEAGTSVDLTGTRRSGAEAWAWNNQGAASATVAQGALVLAIPASSSYDLRAVLQPLAAVSCTYRCKMLDLVSASANYAYGGMAFYDQTTGHWMTLHVRASAADWRIEVCHWADTSAVWSTVYTGDANPGTGRVAHRPIWFELETDGTNLRFRISDSGVDGTFQEVLSEGIATWIESVSHVGLFANGNNSSDVAAVFDLFRQVG